MVNCRAKLKGGYAFASLPINTKGFLPRTKPLTRPPIVLLDCDSEGEDAEVYKRATVNTHFNACDKRLPSKRKIRIYDETAKPKWGRTRQLFGPSDGSYERPGIAVQTAVYLEELTEHIEKSENYVQTETFVDRPPEPEFRSFVTGIDRCSQTDEFELMDFDLEVRPLLEVLVGKTIEQALIEVMEEEELARIREQYNMYEEIRQSELHEKQRLEERALRNRIEKEKQYEAKKKLIEEAKEAKTKIAAKKTVESMLTNIYSDLYENLIKSRYLTDEVECEIENKFYEPLLDDVLGSLKTEAIARSLLDGMIVDATNARYDEFFKFSTEILIEKAILNVIPLLLKNCAQYNLDMTVRMLASRIEMGITAVEKLARQIAGEVHNEVVNQATLELLAEEEARLAGISAEDHDM